MREPRAWIRGRRGGREAALSRPQQAQPRDRDQLQRHALGAPAVSRLPTRAEGCRAACRWTCPGRRRRARDVRRHHARPRRHATLAIQPRRHRDGNGDRVVTRHVRRGDDARSLRQDRAWVADRCAVVRPPTDGVRARGPNGIGSAQQGEGAGTPAVRRRKGRPRRATGGGVEVVPLARHLHLLRHRELQPAADGGHGPAPARLILRQPRNTTAYGAHACRRRACGRDHPAGRRADAHRRARQ